MGRKFFSWRIAHYMSKEILSGFVLGSFVFLLIMLMFQALRLTEFIIGQQVGLGDVLRIGMYMMLSFIAIAIPIAFLFSVLMGVSRANSEGEILALQASGISLWQIYTPLGIFSIFVSFLCLYLSLYTVPQGNRSFELLFTKLGSERVVSALKPGVFTEGFFGLALYAEKIIPVRNELKKVFIYDERDIDHPLAISAQEGIMQQHPEFGVMTLRLTNGAIHIENPTQPLTQQKIEFDVYDINLPLAEKSDGWREYSPPSYNYPQLKQAILESAPNPIAQRELQVELHRRFSLAFACTVFSALGFFIAILSKRGVRSSAIVLCLLVALAYWISYIGANALAISGAAPAWISIWAPNFFFLGIAYLCYRRYYRT